MQRRIVLVTLLALAGSCGKAGTDPDSEPSTRISPLDGRDLEDRDEFGPIESLEELELVSPVLDTDGDGLVDVDEIVGWTIRVDSTGRPQGVETRVVTSDPYEADTDQDGLPDGLERISGSDPNIADTDGDGLDDADEVKRWGTSPASVDTDADSRGDDPSAAPRVELFDGAELEIGDDGFASPDATSPVLADTDGDGRTDLEELAVATRSGNVADVPVISVVQSPDTLLGVYFTTTETTGSMEVEEITTEMSGTMSNSLSTTSGHTSSLSGWVSNSIEVGTTTSVEAAPVAASAMSGGYVEQRSGVGMRQEQSFRMGLSTSLQLEWRQLESNLAEWTRSNSRTVSGGRLAFSARLRNDGPITVRIKNLALSASFFDASSNSTRPAATLRPAQEPEQGYTLAAGESVDVIVEASMETEPLRQLLAGATTFIVSASGYDVVDAGDEQYALTQSRVDERTSTIVIEGLDGPETYKVATSAMRDDEGRQIGLTLGEALGVFDYAYTAQSVENPRNPQFRQLVSFGGGETEFYESEAPELDTVSYPDEVEPGPRWVRQGWVALVRRADGRTEVSDDIFETRLLPGDRLALVWATDHDRDGISNVEEDYAGTSDDNIDTDDDGLSDYYELRARWRVEVEGQPTRYVSSSPTIADTDGDGVSDFDEILSGPNEKGVMAGTDPTSADTDRDGFSDAEELADPDDEMDPLRTDNLDEDPVECTTNLFTGPFLGQPLRSTYRVVDDEVLIRTVVVQFANGVEEAFEHVPAPEVRRTILYFSPAISVYGIDSTGQRTQLATCDTEVF